MNCITARVLILFLALAAPQTGAIIEPERTAHHSMLPLARIIASLVSGHLPHLLRYCSHQNFDRSKYRIDNSENP